MIGKYQVWHTVDDGGSRYCDNEGITDFATGSFEEAMGELERLDASGKCPYIRHTTSGECYAPEMGWY